MKALFSRRKQSKNAPAPAQATSEKQGKTDKENRPLPALPADHDDQASLARRPSSKLSYRSRFASFSSKRSSVSSAVPAPTATPSSDQDVRDRSQSRLSMRPLHIPKSDSLGGLADVMAHGILLDHEEGGIVHEGRVQERSTTESRRVTFDSTTMPRSLSFSSDTSQADPSTVHSRLPSPTGNRASSSVTQPRPASKRMFSLPPLSSLRSASRPASPRSGSFGGRTSPTKSIISPTPSDFSHASSSAKSYLPQAQSWSDMAGEDLISNLGPKERTRQEVLWEIVSSEER